MARNKKGTPSKSEFIRRHLSLPVGDIIGKAKEAGLVVSPNLVYMVRGRVGSKSAAKPGAAKRTAAVAATRPASAVDGGAEVAFRRLVLDLGVTRARALVDEVTQKLDALLRG